jgi:hypothetical protein
MKSRVLAAVACVAASVFQSTVTPARAEEAKPFAFGLKAGETLDVMEGGKIVGRYMVAHDTSTPARLNETYKPYLHVFDAEGKAPITKGPGGEYTHHRGIYIGWNKIGFNGKTYDRWHMKGGEQVVQGKPGTRSDADSATVTSTVHWNDEAGKPLIVETRTMTFRRAPAPAYALIDFQSVITAPNGDVKLDGDPEHAGIHFRPANEVDKAKTTYVYAGANVDPHKVTDLAWMGETFSLNGKTYSVVQMNHPDNPAGTRVSAYRNYGRFGMFPTATVKSGESRAFRYRFLVAEGPMPAADVLQPVCNAFTGKTDPVPAVTAKAAEQPAPPKAKEPKKDAKKPGAK